MTLEKKLGRTRATKNGYVGIDYGLGQSNIDRETGIRYGVISQNSILQAWADSSEPQYGKPHCPKCGNEAETLESKTEQHGDSVSVSTVIPEEMEEWETDGCGEYVCRDCQYLFDGEQAFGDEPLGYTYDGNGYLMESCLDTDVVITRSPFYTFAQFCSPCVPGAGNLDNPMPNGVKCYALGHDWFDSGKAPYPLYDVKTGKRVKPEPR